MSWLENLWNSIWDVIKLPLEAVLKAAEAFALAGAKSIAINGGLMLIDAATSAVEAMAATDGSGKDKRDAAINAVVAQLESKGVPVVENAVRLAVETAVANLKADIPELNQPAPPPE